MNQAKLNDQTQVKVLWMDDNPSKTIDNELFEAGIETKACTTAEAAVNEYLKHRGTYQAVILDLEGADRSADEFSLVVKELEPYLKQDLIPLYVLTNYTVNDLQYKLARGTIASYKLKDDIFFHKKMQLVDLIERIRKDVVQGSEWFRIYKKYEEAFGAFESGIFDVGYQDSLRKIILCASGGSTDFIGLFNEMRRIYEMVFYKFMIHKLPADYYYGKAEIFYKMPSELPMETKRNVTDFLNGKEIIVRRRDANIMERIKIKEGPVLPLVMADIFDRLREVLNTNSHYNPVPGNHLTNKDLSDRLPHFFESTALLLIDLIVWARNEIQDKKCYSFQRIIPSPEIRADKSDLIPAAVEPLQEGETRIEVKVSKNINNKDWPRVRPVKNSTVYMALTNKCPNRAELLEWMENRTEVTVKAVVKNAYEVVRFEF